MFWSRAWVPALTLFMAGCGRREPVTSAETTTPAADPAPKSVQPQVTAIEPGLRIVARGLIRDPNGAPLPDVLVYVYQTDDRGYYAADTPHVSGFAGDQRHARLFGYVRTGPDGFFEVHTIRPVGYPKTDLPAHIHVEVFRGEEELLVTEMLFEDDPRLTAAAREQALGHGFVIAPRTPGPDGTVVYAAEFTCWKP